MARGVELISQIALIENSLAVYMYICIYSHLVKSQRLMLIWNECENSVGGKSTLKYW